MVAISHHDPDRRFISLVGARRALLVVIAAAALTAALLSAFSHLRTKRSGFPLVEFEIRLPAGILLPDDKNIGVMLWRDKAASGLGCKIARVMRSGVRPVVAGNCIAGRATEELLSLRLNWYSESYWRMPITSQTPLDQVFGPWQPIEFVRDLVKEESPLPRGEYDVRYRVSKYL